MTNIYLQLLIGTILLLLGLLLGRYLRPRQTNGTSLLSQMFQNNKDLDSTISLGLTFIGFFVTVGTISGLALKALPIPTDLWNLVNMFENFILMILSSFFTKAHAQKES